MIYNHLTQPPQRRPLVEATLPLVNVVFLLLIFFMISGTLAPQSPLAPPVSDMAELPENRELAILTLESGGDLSLAGQPVTLAELARSLSPTQPVRLLADGQAPLEQLRPVLITLQNAGIREVRLVTRSRK